MITVNVLWRCVWWVINPKTYGEKNKVWGCFFLFVLFIFNVGFFLICFEVLGNARAVGRCVQWTRIKGQSPQTGFKAFSPPQPGQHSGRAPWVRNCSGSRHCRRFAESWGSCRNPSSWPQTGGVRGRILPCPSSGQGQGLRCGHPMALRSSGWGMWRRNQNESGGRIQNVWCMQSGNTLVSRITRVSVLAQATVPPVFWAGWVSFCLAPCPVPAPCGDTEAGFGWKSCREHTAVVQQGPFLGSVCSCMNTCAGPAQSSDGNKWQGARASPAAATPALCCWACPHPFALLGTVRRERGQESFPCFRVFCNYDIWFFFSRTRSLRSLGQLAAKEVPGSDPQPSLSWFFACLESGENACQ